MTAGAVREFWVIEKMDVRTWWGSGTGAVSDYSTYEFGARVPIFYTSLEGARDAWLKYAVLEGYLERGVTLPSMGRKGIARRYHPGENFGLMPQVCFRQVTVDTGNFEIPTHEDLGIVKK